MSLSAAMDLLVTRLETYTPTNDPAERFFHQSGRNFNNARDRAFRILPEIVIQPNEAGYQNPCLATIQLEVIYREKQEEYASLKRLVDDASEVFLRVSYAIGDCWAQAQNYTFYVRDFGIREEKENSRNIINFKIEIGYNLGE